ncbi:MAG: polyribonucleotide nucleotidyltransferase [Candidatus Paceibacterota bacterium]|jgi:polyribonucleotide nucleotidyltransferase
MKKEIFKTDIGGKELKVEINDLAEQASGSVLVQYGDTTVMANVTAAKTGRDGVDFFPLTVEYEEKFYAAGKILGSRFLRRETKPSDEAILTARFIDRAIRPCFPEGYKNEVQVIVTCLSWDEENDPDVIGLIAASLALAISDIPWKGPVAALRLGRNKDNEFVVNPTYPQRTEMNFELTVAGLESEFAKFLGNEAKDNILINMMEAEGMEVEETVFAEAVEMTKPHLEKILNFQKDIAKKVGKEKMEFAAKEPDAELESAIKDFLGNKLETALFKEDKDRMTGVNDLKKELVKHLQEKYPDKDISSCVEEFFEKELNDLVHKNILEKERRVDGRKIDELRSLETQVGILPRTHGSGLFMRGQTKALSILTLGAPGDVKLMEGMEIRGKKRFMHHYNFPPYCSGEVKPLRGPGRREIGHGMLAEKAIFPMIPNAEDFPYTIRIVTEILSSNGSTSQASISSSVLALMDAGVPIKKPVAGIAMGLMSDYKGAWKTVTDIQGPEDHHGDMDFKIAGTKDGITAVQMDVKIEGIGKEVVKKALEEAKTARIKILAEMAKSIEKPRENLSPYAPRIIVLQINPDKIREVIGPGGKVINEIIDECGVLIDIEDSGKIFVTAEKESAGKRAADWINNLTREVKVGELFEGKVKRILDFGAFVEILPGQEGLVHISQLANYHVNKVEDIVKIGDIIPVKVISIDEQGRINLSHKEAKKE